MFLSPVFHVLSTIWIIYLAYFSEEMKRCFNGNWSDMLMVGSAEPSAGCLPTARATPAHVLGGLDSLSQL